MCWFVVTFMRYGLPEEQGGDPLAPFQLAVFTTDARKAIQAAEIEPGFSGGASCRGVSEFINAPKLKHLLELTTARRVY